MSGSEEKWRDMLTGDLKGLRTIRRIVSHIPRGERCKLCTAPFGMPGAALFRVLGMGRSRLNPWLCRFCIRDLERHPGGAEVEISLLFADVRGSTGLAESRTPAEYRRLIDRFYGAAARAVNRWDGVIDKFVGDEVVALFVPGFAGPEHRAKAIEAGRDLLRETGHGPGSDPWVKVGGGVHTGVAYVGTAGPDEVVDFTALGDPVNVAARLAERAGVGELLVSREAAEGALVAPEDLPVRTLDLRGRSEPLEVLVLGT